MLVKARMGTKQIGIRESAPEDPGYELDDLALSLPPKD